MSDKPDGDGSTSRLEPDDALKAEAARWLARRDRGFTAGESHRFDAWKGADPRRAAAVDWINGPWNSLDRLRALAPGADLGPDPDLLAPAPQGRRFRFPILAAAAAAMVVLGVGLWHRKPAAPAWEVSPSLSACRRIILPDGSVANLKGDSQIEPRFTPTERRIRLVRGEANFSVEKNPARPFLVSVGPVVVRSIGTVFDVAFQSDRVVVLVTEGKVGVAGQPAVPGGPSPSRLSLVGAGQRALISAAGTPIIVQDVSTEEINRLLAWQGKTLEFGEKSLEDVVAEFNRRNERKLVIGDPEIGRIQVGGNFQADNIDAFVRLLEAGFGVAAENRDGDAIVLRKAR